MNTITTPTGNIPIPSSVPPPVKKEHADLPAEKQVPEVIKPVANVSTTGTHINIFV